MFAESKEIKTYKRLLLTVLIALAVIIFLAITEKANAANQEIKSIEYIQAKENFRTTVIAPMDFYIEPWPALYVPKCDPETFKKADESFIHAHDLNYYIWMLFEGDKLVLNYVDGSTQTLSSRIRFWYKDNDEATYEPVLAWVDENNNVTDIVTKVSFDRNEPERYFDENILGTVFKKGSYDCTATVEVDGKKTTFTKKYICSGNSSAFDETIPTINKNKIMTGFKKSYKKDNNIIIDGFWMRWPENMSIFSYIVKVEQIYPESINSSKYNTKSFRFSAANTLEIAGPDFHLTDNKYLTADTMIEISINIIEDSSPAKTGAYYLYGKFSKPARFFLSKNKTLKAVGKKKSVSLTWDKIKNATGYTIKYSTKKNMSKAKTIKVKGVNKKAYTIKKLKKNKKYYFQITPYKVYKGKTYTGYTSAKKAAKAK